MRWWMKMFVWCVALLVLLSWRLPAAVGQMLSGSWVDRQNERIEEHRKGNVRIIVLDAKGNPVPDAQVHVAMQRHAFGFGVRLDPSMLAGPGELAGGDTDDTYEARVRSHDALWSLFNSVSIEATGNWLETEPEQGKQDWSQVEPLLKWASARGLDVHMGQVVTGDLSRLPVWVTKLDDASLAAALEKRVDDVAARLQGRVVSWDVVGRLPDHLYIQQRLGSAMLRRLMTRAQARAPQAARGVRFDDTLGGQRLTEMVQMVTELRDAQSPVSHMSMDVKLSGSVAYVSLERALEWLAKLRLGIRVVNLEVGAASPQAAAINLETTLRTFFSQKEVEGIYFHGVTSEQLLDPSAALVDEQGQLTPAGRLFVQLAGKQWWSDEIMQADKLGNVRLRVFAGDYRIQARWLGGQATIDATIPAGKGTRLVILQQLAID